MENESRAVFCAYCGSRLTADKLPDINSDDIRLKAGKKAKRLKLTVGVISGVLLLMAVTAASVFISKDRKEKQQFSDMIAKADRYLEEMDYEKAEDMYLRAIKVEPREEEPYLKLIDLYLDQGRLNDAVSVAGDANNNVPEPSQDIIDIDSTWTDVQDYSWVVNPSVEADNIDYLQDADNYEKSANERYLQVNKGYAVIEKDGKYGIIDDRGQMATELCYRSITRFNDRYIMRRETPEFEPEMHMDWDQYFFDEETGRTEIAEGLGGAPDKGCFYYYNGEIHNTNEILPSPWDQVEIPDTTFPVMQLERPYEANSEDSQKLTGMDGAYGLYSSGALLTDFVFEKCGSLSEGVFAVKQNGKWGYINEAGETIIPCDYDASWNSFYITNMEGTEPIGFCYAVSGGYIPLVKDGIWELWSTEGKCVIPDSQFEAIRPVKDGRCWVKKDGLWGIIQIAGAETTEISPEEEMKLSDESIQTYEDGDIELTGTLWIWERIHENAEGQVDAYMLKLDTPANFRVNINYEEEYYENCEDIQVINVDSGISEHLLGKHVKVSGTLGPDAGTAYYAGQYAIYNAVIEEE